MKTKENSIGVSKLTANKVSDLSTDILITGGSIAGIKTALEISRLGFKATLLEKNGDLQHNHLNIVDHDPNKVNKTMLQKMYIDKNINVLSPAFIMKIDGTVGDFSVKIKKNNEIFTRKYGIIIVAGANMMETVPVFLNFQHTGIITQQKLSQLIGDSFADPVLKKAQTIAFVFTDPSENSRQLVISGLEYSCLLKTILDCEVYVFITHLIVDSQGVEEMYRKARKLGVVFVKYKGKFNITSDKKDKIGIEVKDIFLNEDVQLFCDLLITGDQFVPYSQMAGLKAGYDAQGYYQDANIYLYPVLSRRKGIFFVGECRGDQDITRIHTDILNAAIAVYELITDLKTGFMNNNVNVEPEKCQTCFTCIRVCPHRAIRLVPFSGSLVDKENSTAEIFPAACYDCGICSSFCPAKAIHFKGSSDEQIIEQITSLEEGSLVVFCCTESALLAVERAKELKLEYPPHVEMIRVPCIGRVDMIHIFKAFEQKVSGVLLAGCPVQACTHLEGNNRAKERVAYARELLKDMGINEQRLRITFLGPDMAHRVVREIMDMLEILNKEEKDDCCREKTV